MHSPDTIGQGGRAQKCIEYQRGLRTVAGKTQHIAGGNLRPTRFALMACLTVMAVLIGASPDVPAQHKPPPGNDIQSFVDCLNGRLDAKVLGGAADVSDTVQCVPAGCKITLTMSDKSAQAACFKDPDQKVGQLPRIILSCPGPDKTPGQRFRPSYLLCPRGSVAGGGQLGTDRIEIGADQEPAVINDPKAANNNQAIVNMQMADVPIRPGNPWQKITDLTTVLNNQQDVKGCIACHGAVPTAPANSPVIDSFGVFKSQGKDVALLPFIIDTTEPNKTTLVNPTAPGTKKQDLTSLCDDPNMSGNLSLCRELRDYQTDRSCGTGMQGGLPLVCAGINGGGIFLSGDPAIVTSVVFVDLSGQATKNATTFQFVDTESALVAYNFGTRTLISCVSITSRIRLAMNANGYTVSGSGQAAVNGQDTNIALSITQAGAVLTVQITDAGTGKFLAGGTARPGTKVQLAGFD